MFFWISRSLRLTLKALLSYLWKCAYMQNCTCVHTLVPTWMRMCAYTRLLGRNRLIPLEVRHCWNLATGARGLPPQRSWLPRHIHYQPRILGWIKNSCCLQQQRRPPPPLKNMSPLEQWLHQTVSRSLTSQRRPPVVYECVFEFVCRSQRALSVNVHTLIGNGDINNDTVYCSGEWKQLKGTVNKDTAPSKSCALSCYLRP